MVLASFNAGPRNVLEAQKASGNQLFWGEISPFLHTVTGRHSIETIGYVSLIDGYANCTPRDKSLDH